MFRQDVLSRYVERINVTFGQSFNLLQVGSSFLPGPEKVFTLKRC